MKKIRMEKLKEFKATKTVYGYYFPEVRKAIDELLGEYPHDIFLKWCEHPGLDNWHIPIIDRYIDYQKHSVFNLRNFPFRYPTAGSSEGIREILTFLQAKRVKKIYVLRGEYEGYKETAKTRLIETIEVNPSADPENIEKGYWFISNPSAIDGNIIPDEFINRICDAGHQVFYDLTYLGLTEPHKFDLSHPNIFAVATSFSKPFGLFSYRIGFVFAKEEIPSLYSNIWFKSIPGLLIADKVMAEINQRNIWKRYEKIQKGIIEQVNKQFGLGIKTSDVILLGYKENTENLNTNQRKIIEPFKRGDLYRFCLTPYYQDEEKNKL